MNTWLLKTEKKKKKRQKKKKAKKKKNRRKTVPELIAEFNPEKTVLDEKNIRTGQWKGDKKYCERMSSNLNFFFVRVRRKPEEGLNEN